MNVLALAGPALPGFQQAVLVPFLRSDEHPIVGCLIDARPRRPLRERLTVNLRRGRGGYVIVMAVNLLLRRREAKLDTRQFFERRGIRTVRTVEPYGEPALAWIRELRPDVMILLGGFGVVRAPLLAIAPHGVLSYHHGDMRRYRGQPPAFWELYNGERALGLTVQRLTEELDAGEPIVERRIEIYPGDSLRSLRERADEASVGMMFEAVARLGAPGFRPERVEWLGHLYTLPNLHQWLLFQLKMVLRLGARLRARRQPVHAAPNRVARAPFGPAHHASARRGQGSVV